ncbi:MAG: aldehyde dehydrogenase family protein, partial [Pseudomonadota bacterium]
MAAQPTFQAHDPATGQPGRTYNGHTDQEALAIARAARACFEVWKRTSFAERAVPMRRAAQVLRRRATEFAALMTDEMGKTLSEGLAEIEKCAAHCDYFAEQAAAYLSEQPVDMGGPKAKVAFRPLGTILAVMPWNFPFWQVIRFAAPTLMAGNTAVLKHASNVPGCALALEEVFREAGFPADAFRSLLIPSRAVKMIIEDPAIAAVSLTGSVPAGKQVASQAAAVLKKSVLELGGSDAYLVLEDVDVPGAAHIAAAARMVNAGQSCIAGKRFIVVAEIREAFESALVEAMRAFEMGDPRDRDTKLGPLQSVEARDGIHRQVTESLAKGARLLLGGQVPD